MSTDRATQDLVARDLASVWHPFTQHAVWADDDPLVVDHAEGMHLVGTDGRRYLDGVSSLWVAVHGHRVPEIDAAVVAQLGRVAHSTFLGLTHEPGIELAERLVASAPAGLRKVFYAGDGSSAVEAAVKMAYQATVQRGESRPLIVALDQAYHGDTLGSVSVGGIDTFHAAYRDILLDVVRLPSPSPLHAGTAGALAALRTLMEQEGHRVCAVVVEPLVQAAAGMLTHSPEFLRGVRAACDAAGALLVVDEVATGVGATGTMWAVEQAGIAPDLLALGKRVTGGYLPLSAVLATDAVYEAFLGSPASGRTFFHGHTYTANPLACAAANANLALMDERGTVARAAAVGEAIGAALQPLVALPGVRELRRLGTMTGLELEPVTERTGFEVCRRARERGVWVRPLGDVVVLMPPLSIGDDDLATLTGTVVECVREVCG